MAQGNPFEGMVEKVNPFDGMEERSEEKPVSSAARRFAGDPLVSLAKGVVGAGEAPVGLANLVTGGYAGKGLESLGYDPKRTKQFLDDLYSPEQKAANQKLQETKGFLPTIAAALQNPSTILHAGIESVPSMLGGGAVARGALKLAPKMSAVSAGALGEGVVGAGSAAEGLRQETQDGTLSPVQSALAAGSGALTGALTLGAGRVSKALGISDIDTMLAGGAAGAAKKGLPRRVAEGVLSEGVLEELPQSAQEQVAQNLALGRPWDQGVAESAAMGALVGGAIGGGANVPRPHQPAPQPKPQPKPPIAGLLPAPGQTVIAAGEGTPGGPNLAEEAADIHAGSIYAARDAYEREQEALRQQQGQQPVSGLLPAPGRTVADASREPELVTGEMERQAAIDAAERNASEIEAARAAEEARREQAMAASRPEPPQSAGLLPRPGEVAIPMGGPDASTNPLDLSRDLNTDRMVAENEALHQRREQVAQQIEAAGTGPAGTGALSSAAAQAVRSGVSDASVGQTASEPRNAPTGPETAVSSRPAGIPMDRDTAIRAATNLSNSTGLKYEVVPHPTVAGKYAAIQADRSRRMEFPEITGMPPASGQGAASQGLSFRATGDFFDHETSSQPHQLVAEFERLTQAPTREMVDRHDVRAPNKVERAQIFEALRFLRGQDADQSRATEISRITVSIKPYEDGATGTYHHSTGSIDLNPAELERLRANPNGHIILAQVMDHEQYHGADHVAGAKAMGRAEFHSSTDSRFDIGQIIDGRREPLGEVMTEAYQASRLGPFKKFLAYPFDGFHKEAEASGLSERDYANILKNEVFAQLGVIYNQSPVAMSQYMPAAYKLFKEIHDLARAERIHLSRAVARTIGKRGQPSARLGDQALQGDRVPGARDTAVPPGQYGQPPPRRARNSGPAQEVAPQELRGDGRGFTKFFAEATQGKRAPNTGTKYTPVLDISHAKDFSREYKKHRGNFDDHIATSIPGFREVQQAVGHAIAKAFPGGARVVDIGASEGSFIKAISAVSGGKIETVGVDPNPAMAKFFAEHSQVPGSRYEMAAFSAKADEGKPAWTEDDGTVISNFKPDGKFDVAHEAMTFQFISNARDAQVARVKELLKPGGVAMFEQKFIPDHDTFSANEAKKDEYKARYYSQAELDRKKKDVLERGAGAVAADERAKEAKVVGMHDLMVSPEEFERVLKANFKHVVQYWDSGNFKGYAASDDALNLGKISSNLTTLRSEFSTVETPRQVKGVRKVEGEHVVNIGLNTNDGKGVAKAEALKALRELGVEVESQSVHQSDTEQTLIARLSRPLTPEEAHRVSEALHQEAIAQVSNGSGELYGPQADNWKPFNPSYFLTPGGRRLSELEVPKKLAKHVTEDEKAMLESGAEHHVANRIEQLQSLFEELPSAKDFMHAALEGRAARGWYKRSREAGEAMYGADYPRFAALMAALSPQTDVETNFYNAAKVWREWKKGGRPTDASSIVTALRNNLLTPDGRKMGRDVMSAYVFNVTRALRAEDPLSVRLSGPKVESFRNNLIGNLDEVTNDRHIAAFSGIIPKEFEGREIGRDEVGRVAAKAPGYIAASARIRAAASEMSKATGDTWKPAEVQETVWSFWKALYDLAYATGETRSALQLLRDGALTHEMIARVPDLGSFFDEGRYKEITGGEAQGIGGDPARAARISAANRGAARETGPVASSPAGERIARRLDRFLEARRRQAESNREAGLEEADDDLPDFGSGEPDETPRLFKLTGFLKPETSGPVSSPDAPAWVKSLPETHRDALRKAGVWTSKEPLRERWNKLRAEASLKFIQGTVDQFRPVLSKIGEYPYKLLRMAGSSAGALEQSLYSGHVELSDWGALKMKAGTKGLLEILEPLKGEADRFLAWVAGNRAARLMKEGREHNFTEEQIGHLKSLNEDIGEAWKGDGTRAETYTKALKEWNEFSKSILDVAEKAGLIDAEGRKQWEHEFYVPFYRQIERATPDFANLSGMVNKEAFHRLTGGEKELRDLLANSIGNWGHLLDASLRNNAAWQTLQHAEDLGIATQVKSSEVAKGDVFVMQDGKKVYYRVNDPLVFDAISSLAATPFKGPATKALSAFKNALTHGVTMSPTFRVNNVIRDQVSALAQSDVSYNLVTNIQNGFKYSSKNNPEYANMAAGGAFMRLAHNAEGGIAAHIKRLIAEGVEAATVLDDATKVKGMFKRAYEWWEATGERSESLTRANVYRQVYDKAIKKGLSEDQAHFDASYAARDALDFSLHGKWAAVRFLTQVVPFMSARMQGLYKLGRSAQADPKRFAAVAGAVTLATIALSLANADDDEIKNLPDSDHDNFWIFRAGDKVFRVPKPFEIGALATVVDRGLRLALDGFKPSDRGRFAEQLGRVVGSQLAMNPIPQAVWPALQLWANKDVFRGAAIETERDQNLTTAERIGPNTSAVAQLAGKAGVLSPQQIDFAVNAYLGWAGSHAIATADLALRPMMGLPSKPARRVDDYFVIGDFVKQMPGNRSRFVEDFYDHLKEVQQAMGDLRMYQQTGQVDKIAEFLADRKNMIALNKVYSQTQRQLGELNKRSRWVQMRTEPSATNPNGMTAEEKRAELDRIAQLRQHLTSTAERVRSRIVDRPQ